MVGVIRKYLKVTAVGVVLQAKAVRVIPQANVVCSAGMPHAKAVEVIPQVKAVAGGDAVVHSCVGLALRKRPI